MADNSTIDAVDFYWRPGCGFCMMLERGLNKAEIPLAKHNIWDDPADAELMGDLRIAALGLREAPPGFAIRSSSSTACATASCSTKTRSRWWSA